MCISAIPEVVQHLIKRGNYCYCSSFHSHTNKPAMRQYWRRYGMLRMRPIESTSDSGCCSVPGRKQTKLTHEQERMAEEKERKSGGVTELEAWMGELVPSYNFMARPLFQMYTSLFRLMTTITPNVEMNMQLNFTFKHQKYFRTVIQAGCLWMTCVSQRKRELSLLERRGERELICDVTKCVFHNVNLKITL